MAAFEKSVLENFKYLSLRDLDEVAYVLQIEYDHPLTEDQRPKVLDDIKYIIRHDDKHMEAAIKVLKKVRSRRKRLCNEKVAIMKKGGGLMSDSQIVFLPQIEIKYFCLDRHAELHYAIENKINPINGVRLTNSQLQFLIEQKDGHFFSDISAGDLFEEIERRIGDYTPLSLNKSQQSRISFLRNNPRYKKWIARNLEQLSNIKNVKNAIYGPGIKICNIEVNKCLELIKRVAKGGGSYVIETRYKTTDVSADNNLFPVDSKYRFVMKLWNNSLDSASGRELYIEAYNLLLYSQLFNQRICETFNYAIGYGINCCVLFTPEELATPPPGGMESLQNYPLLEDIFKTSSNIGDYYEEIADMPGYNCDSFVLMNYISGNDMLNFNSNRKKLSDRQLFELVYGYLCSCYFFMFIPEDVHDDNFIEHDTGASLRIQIGETILKFSTTLSIIWIDYQVTSVPIGNIESMDVKLSHFFEENNVSRNVIRLLNSNMSCLEKIYALPEAFLKYIDTESNPLSDEINLRFKEVL